ncbi:MAG: hypothetical protein KBT20_04965 [Bacteroidales bacterium]|nr:hypothetical protein [Candidatus Liminaster caballi]
MKSNTSIQIFTMYAVAFAIRALTSCSTGSDDAPTYSDVERDFIISLQTDGSVSGSVALMGAGPELPVQLLPNSADSSLYEGSMTSVIANGAEVLMAAFAPYEYVSKDTSNTEAVLLDYSGQDGTLSRIAEKFDYRHASFMANSISQSFQGRIVASDEPVVLRPCYSLLRLVMTDSEGCMSLREKFAQISFAYGRPYSITSIVISEYADEGQVFDAVVLNPANRMFSRSYEAHRYVKLAEDDGYDMSRKLLIDEPGVGSSCDVALPFICSADTARLSLRVTVSGTIGTEPYMLYGRLQPTVMRLGGSYVTEPVRCYFDENDIPASSVAGIAEL